MAQIKKKHVRSFAIICSAAVLMLIRSTIAYFTSTDTTTNKFVSNRFDIILTETKWNPEAAKEVMPGDELDKNPQVMNIESTDAYVFLRVTVPCDTEMVDNADGTPLGTIGADIRVPMYKFMVWNGTDYDVWNDYVKDSSGNIVISAKQKVNSQWELISEGMKNYTEYLPDTQQYVYVYAYAQNNALTPLKKGEVTEPLFDKLQLWNFSERKYEPGYDHSVKVEAYGIQTNLPGLDAVNISEIWKIAKGGSSE